MMAWLLNDDQKERCIQDVIERLLTESALLYRVITDDETWIFGIWSGNQASEQSVEPSDFTKSRESKTVKSHVDHILQCEGHHPRRVRATELDDQGVPEVCAKQVREKRRNMWQDKSWLLHQDNATAHKAQSSLKCVCKTSAREETKFVAGQIMATSPRQCNCSQSPEFLKVCVQNKCARRDEICGRTNHGYFTKTMQLLTMP